MGHVTVPVGRSFPNAHGGKVRRLEGGDMPLVYSVIRNAVDPDFARRPVLNPGPFDTVVKILSLARREVVDVAWRPAGAATINAHDCIAFRHTLFRVHNLPILVQIA